MYEFNQWETVYVHQLKPGDVLVFKYETRLVIDVKQFNEHNRDYVRYTVLIVERGGERIGTLTDTAEHNDYWPGAVLINPESAYT